MENFTSKKARALYNQTMRDKVENFVSDKSWILDEIKEACLAGKYNIEIKNIYGITRSDADCLRWMGYKVTEYSSSDLISW